MTAVSSRPIPALIQNRLSRCPVLRVGAWIDADVRPKSRKISPIPTTTRTIAIRP